MDYEKLTQHELEAEVAKQMQDWKDIHNPLGCTFYMGKYQGENRLVPSYLQPIDFEDVKREIERRGWEWACEFRLPEHNHEFTVFNEHFDAYIGVDDSEFRAGCIAFLRACEVAEQEEKDG